MLSRICIGLYESLLQFQQFISATKNPELYSLMRIYTGWCSRPLARIAQRPSKQYRRPAKRQGRPAELIKINVHVRDV